MSTIKVEVIPITQIRPHSNADALELATVAGWQMCVKKGVYQAGDPVVYFEQGTTLPRAIADELGVTQYLSEKIDIQGDRVLVIHRVKLRGEPSFGLVITPPAGMTVGQDVAAVYGATKFQPPVRTVVGDSAPADPRFPPYTDIEHMRSYPMVMAEGEIVVATEKLHGTNCRVGFVTTAGEMVLMAGSRGLRRKMPPPEALAQNTYWFPHTLPGVAALLQALAQQGHQQAVLFGEVYGSGVQAYTYGKAAIAFAAFDLMVDGQYCNYDDFCGLCDQYGVDRVPIVDRGPFSLAMIQQLSDGKSLVGGHQGREGVVVRPTIERQDSKIGRVILKYIGDHYLFGKVAEQDTTDL